MKKVTRRKFLYQLPSAGLLSMAVPTILKATSRQSDVSEEQKSFNILFQGDSITDGNRGRTADPNHIMGHGYAFSIASRLGADYPERNLKFINKGISGNTVSDLVARWQTDTFDLKPDVVSILVGVNDVYFKLKNENSSATDDFESTYRKLLSSTRETLPNVLLVLGEPFILPVGMVKENLDQWMKAIEEKQHVVKKLSSDFNAVFVGYQQVFSKASKRAADDYWIWDGIHPTVPGHELMAREWIHEVSKRLPIITPKNK